ncbi:transcriptional regulator [Mycobacterium sp. CBMA 234]|uniref:helix-turn-helix transcriptional regulator n=1 Tax=Mycolicibacterium sp. CBMA 234 TaxID=1918495 RepID=UPI0012DDA0A9|nr:helix-turn-helix transcriptional regulator [Mycolicibacterium sp. CBMA 234]MUL65617.1 transcriptional regulator [Mycolicibacterium sp. CBMA 234]
MDRRNELGAFLKARRASLSPRQAGVPADPPRRVSGLRREEVAALAGVSADYYTRLEQGREQHPSDQVLQAISRALQLDTHAEEHLANLARAATAINGVPPVRDASEGTIRIVNDVVHAPALVISPALDVLAMNARARALYSDHSRVDNLAYMVFLDPVGLAFYVDWDEVARDTVRNLRAMSVRFREDPRIAEVVGELTIQSDAFTFVWMQHDVRPRTSGTKRFRHSQVGEVNLRYDTFSIGEALGQQLLIYSAEPGSRDADSLELLGRSAAEQSSG